MLRHSDGYKLANDGVDTRALQHLFGHRNIQNTVRYTELSPGAVQELLGGGLTQRAVPVGKRA